MSDSFSLWVGWRYTRSRRRSRFVSFLSMISIAGMTLAVALLIVVLSVMNGFDRELRDRILSVVPHASIHHRDMIDDWRNLHQQVENHPMVSVATPFTALQGMVMRGREAAPVLIHGIIPSQESRISPIEQYLTQGVMFSDDDTASVVISQVMADRLGIAVGDSLSVVVPKAGGLSAGQRTIAPQLAALTVAGIFETRTNVDQRLVMIPLALARSLATDGNARADSAQVDGMRLELVDLFDAPRIVYELIGELPFGHYGRNWTSTHGNLYHAIGMSKKLVGLILVAIIAVAAFNVVSMLVLMVTDKAASIAILRTMGAGDAQVMKIFMVQGALIGVAGTSMGVVLGVALAHWVTPIVAFIESLFGVQFLNTDVYPVSFLPSDVQWPDVLFVSAVALAAGFVATLYPARRASRVQPADVLRYE